MKQEGPTNARGSSREASSALPSAPIVEPAREFLLDPPPSASATPAQYSIVRVEVEVKFCKHVLFPQSGIVKRWGLTKHGNKRF